jgi:hypothetical protein
MTDDELEDALTREISLRIYTGRIGRLIEGRVFVLHWPVAPDAFLLEALDCAVTVPDQGAFYWVRRSDPSLIVERV